MKDISEILTELIGRDGVHIGNIHYVELSDEYDRKAMEDVKRLGSVWLTHAPGKMMRIVGSCSMLRTSYLELVKKHPHLKSCFEPARNKDWMNSKKGCENVEYETDVWGDDWDDSPASSNCGRPYGGKAIPIDAGDLVIVIKHGIPIAPRLR